MLSTSFLKEEKQLIIGKEVESWLINQLGGACLRATEFEDRKLGVDLWVRDERTNTLVPVQITICNDSEVIRRKWCASVSRGIVFIKIKYAQIRKTGERVLEHFWRIVSAAIERAMVFIKKVGEGYQLPLPWFSLSLKPRLPGFPQT